MAARQSQPPESARLIRAARGFAELSQPDLAKALDTSLNTIRRMETGERDASNAELEAIAKACRVPIEFMRDGFDAVVLARGSLEAQRKLAERIDRNMRELRSSVERALEGNGRARRHSRR